MPKCDYCGSTIIIGGVTAGNQRFCNSKCRNNVFVLNASRNVPTAELERQIEATWRGNCPKCGALGPVDVHKYHQVWSALVLTRWTTNQQLSCRSCATKRQLGAMLVSLLAGWWGFPWGLILTPIQVTRNIIGMASGPDSSKPSDSLRKLVQVHIGSQMLAAAQQKSAAVPPIPK